MREPLRYSIVGMVYCNTEQYVKDQLQPGTKLRLARDPNNKADKFAIGIWEEDKLLGYVPKTKQAEIYRSYRANDANADITRTIYNGRFVRSPNSGYPMIEIP